VTDIHGTGRPIGGLTAVWRQAEGEPEGALVLLHGRGADEHDLAGLGDELDPRSRLLAVCPRAPMPWPPGHSWYEPGPAPGVPQSESFAAGVTAATRFLDAFADVTGIPPAATVLAGFSQGAAVALSVGLDPARPAVAGVLAMSGFLVADAPLASAPDAPPVLITHGTLDDLLPVGLGRDARDRVRAAGVIADYRESPVGHGVDPAGLPMMARFVARCLP
jgi:phospholipase/carboxylesterase